MSITEKNAREALRLVNEAERRSAALRSYQGAAPYLILWGCVYAIAYTFEYFRPGQASLAWLILIPIGVAGDAPISRRNRSTINWGMFLGLLATFYGIISAIASIMQPYDPRQMAAFVPLAAAASDAWLLRRILSLASQGRGFSLPRRVAPLSRACWRCYNCGTSLFQQIECRLSGDPVQDQVARNDVGRVFGVAPDLRSSSPKCSPAAQRLAMRRWALILQLCPIAIMNGAKEFVNQPRYFTVLGWRPFIPMARQ
jgi:hypothetical protein